MTLEVWFWIIYVLALLFGGWRAYSDAPSRPYYVGSLIIYVLIGILGWGVFGGPLKH